MGERRCWSTGTPSYCQASRQQHGSAQSLWAPPCRLTSPPPPFQLLRPPATRLHHSLSPTHPSSSLYSRPPRTSFFLHFLSRSFHGFRPPFIPLAQGSATQNVERAIFDQKNKKQICLEPQKKKSLIMKATHALSVYISLLSK